MAVAKVREVHSVVNIETGGWLDRFNAFDGTDEYGGRCFPSLHCDAKTPLDAVVFDDKHEAKEVSNLPYGQANKAKFVVVTFTLPV